ncbi:hypothetical protein CCMA1212_009009 [Trichoderma ghanense]|uniref:Uncharacterized protein n=1 Tax=Trichoderma ghanense TaxID=65468 RepID=A0ABY2GV21_9HYPO
MHSSSCTYLSQLARTAPILGELVNLYTSSKYSLVNANGLAVTLGMYLPTSFDGSIVVLWIFLSKNDRNGLTPDRKKVEWKGTSMPRRGILQRQRLLKRCLSASADNLPQRTLGLLDVAAHLLHVNLLQLEEVGHSAKRVQGAQVTSTYVLHVGDVVVDNFQQPASLLRNVVDDELKSLLVERLGDAAGVDGAHGVVGAAGGITLDGNLHRQTTVEDDRHQRLNGHDVRQSSKRRVFTQRVTSERAVPGNKSLGLHVLEAGLLHQGQGRLGELRGRQETGGRSVGVGTVPDLLGHRAAAIEIHTHALLLRTLSGKDIGRHGLLHLGLAQQNLLLRLRVDGLELDDLATRHHAHVLQLDLDGVVGENHADQGSVEAADTAHVVLGSPRLDQAAHGGAAVHAVGDGAREVGVLREDARHMNGVVVARHASVRLVGGGRTELQRRLAAQRNGVLKVDRLVQQGAVALKIVDHGVAVRLAGLVVHAGDLNHLLRRQLQQDLAPGLHAAEDGLVLEPHQALEAERQGLAQQVDLVRDLVEGKPRLGSQHGHELGSHLHDRLAVADDGAADLDHLSRLLVDDSVDLRSGRHLVALLERLGTGDHAETVGQVHQLQQITIDGAREDGLRDGLPSEHNGKVHGRIHDLAGSVDKGLARIANGVNKVVDGLSRDGGAATVKLARDHGIQVQRIIAKPQLPVELLDAVVATLHDFVDGCISSVGVVDELQRQGNGRTQGGCLLDHVDEDLPVAVQLDLDDIHVLVVPGLLLDDNGRLGGVVGILDLDEQTTLRGEDASNGVGLELLSLHNNIGHEQSMSPVATLNIKRDVRLPELATKVLNGRDRGLVTVVEVLGQGRNVGIVDVVKNVLDGLINDGGELGSSRALENAGSANVLANDCIEVLRLPQGVLLEVELKVLVESRDESDGLLARAQAENEEVLDVLCVDDLVLGLGVGGKDSVNSAVGLLEVSVALEKRGSASFGGESLLDSVDEVASQASVGSVDPSRLVLDIEQLDEAADDLGVGHVLEVHSLALLVAAEPDLLEVIVQLLDDVVTVLLQLSNTLLLGEVEDLLVHLGPELDAASGQLVNGLTHFRAHSDDTTGRALVGLLPFRIIEARSVDDGLLGVLAGVGLLGHHHTASKQAAVKGHGRVSILPGPFTGDVRVGIVGTTEATACDKDDVLLSADSAVHLEDRLVEVLERVVTTTTATSPLQNDGERGVRLGNVDDGLDGLDRAGLEGNVLQAQSLNVLLSNLDRGHTSSNGQPFNGHALRAKSANEGNLPAHGAGVDIDEVDGDTATRRNGLLDLLQCRGHHLGVEVTTTGKLDMVSSIHRRSDKVPGDGRRGHAGNHDGGQTEQTAHLGVDVLPAAGCLDEARTIFLDPVNGILDGLLLVSVKELGLVSELRHGALNGAGKDDADTSSLLRSKTGDAAGTKVKNVRSLREDGRLLPVDGIPGDQSNQGGHNVAAALFAEILSGVGVVDGDTQRAGVDADILEILIDDSGSILQILAVERGSDGKEPVGEPNLSLSVRDSGLVQTGRGLDLAELSVQTVQRCGRARNDQVAGAVDEGDADMTVRREILVGGVNVPLNLLLGQVPDAQHRSRETLAVLLRLSKHGRGHGCGRESLLASRADPEENGQDGVGDLAPRLPRVSRRRRSRHDDTLRVTSGSADALSQETRVDAQDLARNLVVRHLDKPNQGEADGSSDEIVDIRSGLGPVKPCQDIQPLGEHLFRAGVVGQSLQLLGSICDELSNKGGVRLVNLAKFLKVLLNVALAAKDGVDLGRVVVRSPQQSRLRGGQSVDLVALEVGPLELVKQQLEDLLVRTLRIILSLLYLGGDEAQISGNQLGYG